MMQDLFKYKFDYAVLAVIAAIFILYFLGNQSSPFHLVTSTLIFGGSYLGWGIWHHARVGSLTRHVVLEYFLVAALGILIVSSLLL